MKHENPAAAVAAVLRSEGERRTLAVYRCVAALAAALLKRVAGEGVDARPLRA